MNASDIISLFGASAADARVESLFSSLNTLTRPALPEDDRFIYHDWILVRRKGVELGFVDSEYQSAADRILWGRGELRLSQAYFYSGFNDIQPFTGELPYGLTFADNRDLACFKLVEFESTRHGYRNDTWDVDGYRLSVTYANNGASIDRIACRVLAVPIPRKVEVDYPTLKAVAAAFGTPAESPEFFALWQGALTEDDYQVAQESGEIDFTLTYGATLGFASSRNGPVFRSITLHRNRDMESVGWVGTLPLGLDFEDSPEALFHKITA